MSLYQNVTGVFQFSGYKYRKIPQKQLFLRVTKGVNVCHVMKANEDTRAVIRELIIKIDRC